MHRTEMLEPFKDEPDRIDDMFIRMFLKSTYLVPYKSWWRAEVEFASFSLPWLVSLRPCVVS